MLSLHTISTYPPRIDIMDSPTHECKPIYRKPTTTLPQSCVKQEIWRQKQITIFYRSGKPIFNITPETEHLRSINNPHYYVDPKRR